MAKMSHTPAQREAWHAGKKKPGEGVMSWYRRVFIRDRNMRGAYTHPRLKRGIFYTPIEEKRRA